MAMEKSTDRKRKVKSISVTDSFSGIKDFAKGLEVSVREKKNEGLNQITLDKVKGKEKEEVVESKAKESVSRSKQVRKTKGVDTQKEIDVVEEVKEHEKEIDFSKLKMEQARITKKHRDLLKIHSVLTQKNLTLVVWEAIEAYVISNDLKKYDHYGKQD